MAAPYFTAWGLQVRITRRGSVGFGRVKVYRAARNAEMFGALHGAVINGCNNCSWYQQVESPDVAQRARGACIKRSDRVRYKFHGAKRRGACRISTHSGLFFFSVLSIYYIQAFFTIWSICFFRHDWWYLAFFSVIVYLETFSRTLFNFIVIIRYSYRIVLIESQPNLIKIV